MSHSGFPACPDDAELLLRSLGLVEDELAAEIDRHGVGCPRCRARLEALRVQSSALREERSIGHVPARILARWPRRQEDLQPATIQAIERHVDRCGSCTEEIAKLERIRELARDLDDQDEVDEESSDDHHQVLRMAPPAAIPAAATPPATPRRLRSAWWLGGYSALATAAAVLFALRGPAQSPPLGPTPGSPPTGVQQPVAPSDPNLVKDPTPGTASSGGAPHTPDPAAPAPVAPATSTSDWQVRLLPKEESMLVSVLRGENGTESVIRPAGKSEALVVRIEPTFAVGEDVPISMELKSGDGRRTLSRVRLPWKEFHGSARILLSRAGEALPAGHYRLVLQPVLRDSIEAAREGVIEYPFEIGASR